MVGDPIKTQPLSWQAHDVETRGTLVEQQLRIFAVKMLTVICSADELLQAQHQGLSAIEIARRRHADPSVSFLAWPNGAKVSRVASSALQTTISFCC